jgi:hypothetical protein
MRGVFDRHFPERENIFRIIADIYSEGELKLSKPQNEPGRGEALKENFPEVIVAQNMLRSSQRLNNPDAFEQELLNHPMITGITQSGRIPGEQVPMIL